MNANLLTAVTQVLSLGVVLGIGGLALALLPWTEQEKDDTEAAVRGLARAVAIAPALAVRRLALAAR